MRPTVTIAATSPRAADWERVYGSRTVEVESPIPVDGIKPDGTPARFYKLRVASLSTAQRGRLVEFIAERFPQPVLSSAIERDLDDPAHGVPILDEDLTLSVDGRFLF